MTFSLQNDTGFLLQDKLRLDLNRGLNIYIKIAINKMHGH